MYRNIENELGIWKENFELPLMLVGARQTGKTYILDDFCKKNYSHYIYINLEKEAKISEIFEQTIDPDVILETIKMIKNVPFDIDTGIIFFDEIQVSERAITSLKYFAESSLPYKVVCAGSLLGVKINRFSSSFPVGKVIMKNLYPLDFHEFLLSINEDKLVDTIVEHYDSNEPLLDVLHEKCIMLYKKYLVVGGMPRAINHLIKVNMNLSEFDFDIHNQIITAYLSDMNKYTYNTESVKNSKIYSAIPNVLAKENNSFKYSVIDKDARKSRYESSLDWLVSSNMVLKCSLANNNLSPLKAFFDNDKFKLYLSDVGLLRELSNVFYGEIIEDKNMMFKGVFSENYVVNELFPVYKDLCYYNFGIYEIDFLLNIEGDIIPVEVKSGRRVNSRSLNEYVKKYNPSYAIRMSLKNFGFENNIKSIPLYAVFCLKK